MNQATSPSVVDVATEVVALKKAHDDAVAAEAAARVALHEGIGRAIAAATALEPEDARPAPQPSPEPIGPTPAAEPSPASP